MKNFLRAAAPYLLVAVIFAAILAGAAWLLGGRTRALFFPATATPVRVSTERPPAPGSPASTALPRTGLQQNDIANEEELVIAVEREFPFIWIIEVHMLDDGSVWVASTITAESIDYIASLPDEELNQILVPVWQWIMRNFGAEARNGVIYMAAWNMYAHDLRGVIVCEVATEQCVFKQVTPPYPQLRPDDVEYESRLVP